MEKLTSIKYTCWSSLLNYSDVRKHNA